VDTFEHDRDRCLCLFWEPAGPGTRRSHKIGDYEDKDKVSDGQIVIFNGMLA
jgi:hypothetical protein